MFGCGVSLMPSQDLGVSWAFQFFLLLSFSGLCSVPGFELVRSAALHRVTRVHLHNTLAFCIIERRYDDHDDGDGDGDGDVLMVMVMVMVIVMVMVMY